MIMTVIETITQIHGLGLSSFGHQNAIVFKNVLTVFNGREYNRKANPKENKYKSNYNTSARNNKCLAFHCETKTVLKSNKAF